MSIMENESTGVSTGAGTGTVTGTSTSITNRWCNISDAGSEQVAHIVHILHHDNDTWAKCQASNWLKAFQESLNSWTIVDELLRENRNIECSYFAAQTMRSKIRYSFYELPTEAHASLRDSLISHVKRITEESNSVIGTQVCLALADLALQMSSWANPVEDLLKILSPDCSWALLEILTVFPEESTSRSLRLTPDRQHYVELYTIGVSRQVCDFLRRNLDPSKRTVHLCVKTIRCLGSWLSIGAVDLSDVGENAIIADAFRILIDPSSHPTLHKTAADCVCNLLKCLDGDGVDEKVQLIVFNGVFSLEPSYHLCVANEDLDKVLDYTRIFTELAESFLDKVIKYSANEDGYHSAVKVLDLVLISVGHHDYEVAEISFHLWHRLSEELYEKNNENLTTVFVPYIERLLNALCRHCRMEPDHQNLLDKEDEFYEFRQNVQDLTKDVVFIVGSNNCFRRLFMSLQVPDVTWEQTEATLFMMHALARNILPEEYEVVPKVLEAILSMPDTAHVAVRYMSIMLVGELCEWISNHLECLPVVLEYLNCALQNRELSSAAGHALQNVCSTCREHMKIHLPGLIQIVRNLDSFNLSPPAALDLLIGVATVISYLTNEQISTAMREVTAVQVAGLAALNEITLKDDTSSKKDCIVWLDRIAAVFRYCKVDTKENEVHPCLPALTDAWPIISATMNRYANSTRVMEKLCRCLKYIIRSMNLGCLVLIDPLSKQMVAVYTQHGSACFLYLAGIMISEFAVDKGSVDKLVELVQALLVPAFELLQSHPLSANPDTVEDLFRLCQRFLQKLPAYFSRNPLLDTIIHCGLLSCSIDHREANASALGFFSELAHVAQSKEHHANAINAILVQQGEQLIKNIIQLCMVSSDNYTHVADIIFELQIWNKNVTNQWIENALKNIPQQRVTVTQGQIGEFYKTVSQLHEKKDFTKTLKDFSRLYH